AASRTSSRGDRRPARPTPGRATLRGGRRTLLECSFPRSAPSAVAFVPLSRTPIHPGGLSRHHRSAISVRGAAESVAAPLRYRPGGLGGKSRFPFRGTCVLPAGGKGVRRGDSPVM